MTEKAILAIEEALLANLFTQRALIELLIKKGIIDRADLEKEILDTETGNIGIGERNNRLFLEKRENKERRKKIKLVSKNLRTGLQRRDSI